MDQSLIQSLLVWALIGLAAGWLASLVVGGGGLIRYIISGMIGSIVGGWLFSAIGITIPIDNWWIQQILIAAVGAAIVILLARLLAR